MKKGIIVVSFGTSYENNRKLTIGAIENRIKNEFGDYKVYRAFTSKIIMKKMRNAGIEIDDVSMALDRALDDGITNLIIQPTHLMAGIEYDLMCEDIKAYEDKFFSITIAKPLLLDEKDFLGVIDWILEVTDATNNLDTAFMFMGHGSEAAANEVYTILQNMIAKKGINNVFIGTVEAKPDFDCVATMLEKTKIKKVVLQPLMVVAGDHANNDMSGEDEDSWESILKARGYEVSCVIKGMGQYESIQDMYVSHIKDVI